MNQTQANLLKAFAGESMASNKYTFFAEKAKQEGHIWIAKIFEETADNERAHAERLMQYMNESVEMTNTYNINQIGDTKTNLLHAAKGENYEHQTMYPEFKKIAQEEGENQIAVVFQEISEVEEKHEERYLKLAEKIESGEFFESNNDQTEWKCLNCGYVHKGNSAPKICPACSKPQGWYMQLGLIR